MSIRSRGCDRLPNPEWGLMVAETRDFFLRDKRLMTYLVWW
jgi:hypothetical protein